MRYFFACYLSFILLSFETYGQSNIQVIETAKPHVSFRGLDTDGKAIIWVSGSHGTVGRSTDGGNTWTWVSPVGYEDFDFRDIETFGKNDAVVLSAGSPAVILRTSDGGKNWQEVYRNERPDIFLNGFDFQGKTGFAYGDPIDGNFQLLKSTNKGKKWSDVTEHMYLIADEGEIGFAASGTGIQVLNDNVWIGTGGKYSSLFRRNEKALTMDKKDVPLLSGKQSTGIFSIAFWDDNTGVVVGGDYMQEKDNENNVLLTFDGGDSWKKPHTPVSGFRSAVAYLDAMTLVATGPSGIDLSIDGGANWQNISTQGFHTIAVPRGGKRVYFAGHDGRVGILDR